MKNNKFKKKEIIYSSFKIIGILLVLYYIFLKLLFGFVSFSILFCILGIILFIYGYVELKFKVDLWGRIPRYIRGILTTIVAIGLVIFIGVESIIIYNGYHHDNQKPEYLMVLGAGLRGSKISTSLLYRLETALDFHEMYPDVKIIVSGGQGKDESMSEAAAMRNFLVDNGVSPELIIMEDKSTSTYENFLYSKKVLEDKTGKDDFLVTVVSNNFHMYRAKYFANEVGFKTLGYPAPSHKSTALVFYVREFFGVIKAWIFNS
ncbi:YdcF family protein [Clostridioides difficile]